MPGRWFLASIIKSVILVLVLIHGDGCAFFSFFPTSASGGKPWPFVDHMISWSDMIKGTLGLHECDLEMYMSIE